MQSGRIARRRIASRRIAAAAVVAVLGLGGRAAHAQGHDAVLLRLRPRVGDTVRTRFEQTVRLMPRDGGDAPGRAPTGAMTVFAHSVVERADAAGAVVLAVTDSVALTASGAPAHATESARRAMQGRRSRLRVAPDGATAVLGARAKRSNAERAGGERSGDVDLRFPAALPVAAVAPGAMWARAMTVPWGARGAAGAPSVAGSTIDVWFRFDSVARGGTLAFLSLRGTVRGHGTTTGVDGEGASPGGVTGALVVDLARGWVVDSRATFQLDGALTKPGAPPRPVRVVVTQRLRVL